MTRLSLLLASIVLGGCTPSPGGKPSWGDISSWNWAGGAEVFSAGIQNSYPAPVQPAPAAPAFQPSITCQSFGTITRCR